MANIVKKLLGIDKPQEKTVSDALVYRELFENGTVFTKDGRILKVWRAVYPDVVLNPGKAESISNAIDLHFRRKTVDQSEYKTTFWFVVARIPANIQLDNSNTGIENMKDADLEVERRRQEILFGEGSMRNVCYCCASCSVIYDLSSGNITEASLKNCQEFFGSFEVLMASIGTKLIPLEVRAQDPLNDIFNFLKYVTGTGEFYSYYCPDPDTIQGDLSVILSTRAIEKGKPLKIGDTYVQTMTLNIFPDATEPDILLMLQRLPFEFKFVTRWIPLDNFASQKLAKEKRKAFKSKEKSFRSIYYETTTGLPSQTKETQAVVDAERMEDLLEELADGEVLGLMTSTITLFDKDLEVLMDKVKKVNTALMKKGFSAIEEGVFQNYDAWKSSLPGDSDSGRRKIPFKAMNFAHIVPFTDLYRGFDFNTMLKKLTGVGFPLMVGKLFTGELFNFNLNSPDSQLGHFFMIGSTGAGKSVFLALLASQFSRYPNTRVILFDKDYSFKNICARDHGSIYVPASEETPMQFAPLSQMRTQPERAIGWLETVVNAAGTEVTPEMTADFNSVINRWGAGYPTVELFYKHLIGLNPLSEAAPAIKKLIDNPRLATLFCGDTDGFTYKSFSSKTMIEMGQLMELDNITGNVAVLPALQFMFDRIDELFEKDPRPTLLIMDEAWVFLNNKRFRQKIKEWLKTLRKRNVYVGFALQNINDIDDPEEFITSCPTVIYLPNEHLQGEQRTKIHEAYEKMGLTASEIAELGNPAYKSTHHYMIKQSEGTAFVDFCVDKYQLERLARDGF